MPKRLVLAPLLALMLPMGSAAQDLFAPAPPPSEIARVEAAEDPGELLPRPPRVLDDPAPPVVVNPLEESYQGVDPILPNKFGSAPNQRTWGTAGGRFIVNGEKTAPNGVPYHPYFTLDMVLNFTLTKDRSLYIFVDARFWTQSNQDNVAQHAIDFSKRQLDLTPGFAWNYYDRWEFRFFAYSFNNLNRGTTLDKPFGYKDGIAVENRYYFDGTDFDQSIFNYFSFGYYPSKEMVGNDGLSFNPGAFLKWSYNLPLWKERFYAFTIGELIAEKPLTAKWLYLDTGLSCRPFPRYPMLDLRIGNESNVDLGNGKWLPMWYGSVRFTF